MNPVTILWVYIVLLVVGGLVGFLKAGSKASIIASSAFALVLALFALGILPFEYHWIVLVVLLIFFGRRWMAGKKFMPNGLMTVLTIAALAGYFLTRG